MVNATLAIGGDLEQLAGARSIAGIGTVQNRLDLRNRRWRDMLVLRA
jgi:hypothetical protein